MILKKLIKNHLVTVDYYHNGTLQTCKGRVCDIDLYKQSLLLQDEDQKVLSIRLAGIKHIH
ncbi:YolD-like family protein [Bacillus taeanensis]|uniref:YolD-like family protein n=1 Tax=Bacillus taeanensis TaxID=273032 RepID=A0A366Y2N8_9BACI|nr:YolD-like family protein [Bacillus taeanensis]RBW70673.1 hypothetical protein DS031_04100 [Bacillus taeanensis]